MSQHPYQRVRTRRGRRENIVISGCSGAADVEARRELIRQIADQLIAGGRPDRVKDFCLLIGAAKSQKWIDVARQGVNELLATESAAPEAILFRTHALDWTSGALHERFPDYVKTKKSADDKSRLRLYINPLVGDIPLVRFTLEDAQRVMRKLPPSDDFSSASRRHVAQVMYKLLRLAVYPCKIIEHNPLPVGFLPRIENAKAKQYLYPDEDLAVLGCAKIPIAYRLLYGVLDREGCRSGELLGNTKNGTPAITWEHFDLRRGLVRLDENKTDDPRAWALDPGVARALKLWQKLSPAAPFPGVDPNHLAATFREHLELADVDRAELTAPATKARRPIRGHDLRATFITISLANGKSEGWIQDRTGHTSSAMLNRYRRLARQFSELDLGTLGPLDELIPEMNAQVGQKVGKSVSGSDAQVA
jgi:integrase